MKTVSICRTEAYIASNRAQGLHLLKPIHLPTILRKYTGGRRHRLRTPSQIERYRERS